MSWLLRKIWDSTVADGPSPGWYVTLALLLTVYLVVGLFWLPVFA